MTKKPECPKNEKTGLHVYFVMTGRCFHCGRLERSKSLFQQPTKKRRAK